MTGQIKKLAQTNLAKLGRNPYPGRGIVAGLDETGECLVQVYWIMGRSENSRNRVFKVDDETGRLSTEPADASKVLDPSLIIYNAMLEQTPHFVVSNGKQTDAVLDASRPLLLLNEALWGCTYEPDAPNYTQRITAVSSLGGNQPYIQMSILRKSPLNDGCDRLMFVYTMPHRGFGRCITTYSGNGEPLPPFIGDPLLMPIVGGIKEVANAYWSTLNAENRVALAVKWIRIGNGRSDIHIINKYEQIQDASGNEAYRILPVSLPRTHEGILTMTDAGNITRVSEIPNEYHDYDPGPLDEGLCRRFSELPQYAEASKAVRRVVRGLSYANVIGIFLAKKPNGFLIEGVGPKSWKEFLEWVEVVLAEEKITRNEAALAAFKGYANLSFMMKHTSGHNSFSWLQQYSGYLREEPLNSRDCDRLLEMGIKTTPDLAQTSVRELLRAFADDEFAMRRLSVFLEKRGLAFGMKFLPQWD